MTSKFHRLRRLQGEITLTGAPAIITLIAILVLVVATNLLFFKNPTKDEAIMSEIKTDVSRYLASDSVLSMTELLNAANNGRMSNAEVETLKNQLVAVQEPEIVSFELKKSFTNTYCRLSSDSAKRYDAYVVYKNPEEHSIHLRYCYHMWTKNWARANSFVAN